MKPIKLCGISTPEEASAAWFAGNDQQDGEGFYTISVVTNDVAQRHYTFVVEVQKTQIRVNST